MSVLLRDIKFVIEIVMENPVIQILAWHLEAIESRIRSNSRATLGDRSFLCGNFADNHAAQPQVPHLAVHCLGSICN